MGIIFFDEGNRVSASGWDFFVECRAYIGEVVIKMGCYVARVVSIMAINGKFGGLGFLLSFFVYNFFKIGPGFL